MAPKQHCLGWQFLQPISMEKRDINAEKAFATLIEIGEGVYNAKEINH